MNTAWKDSDVDNLWNEGLREMMPEEKTQDKQITEYHEQVMKLTSRGYNTRAAKRLISKTVRKEQKGMRK